MTRNISDSLAEFSDSFLIGALWVGSQRGLVGKTEEVDTYYPSDANNVVGFVSRACQHIDNCLTKALGDNFTPMNLLIRHLDMQKSAEHYNSLIDLFVI